MIVGMGQAECIERQCCRTEYHRQEGQEHFVGQIKQYQCHGRCRSRTGCKAQDPASVRHIRDPADRPLRQCATKHRNGDEDADLSRGQSVPCGIDRRQSPECAIRCTDEHAADEVGGRHREEDRHGADLGTEREHVAEAAFQRFVADALRGLGEPPANVDLFEYLDARPPGQSSLLGELRRDAGVVSVVQGARLPSQGRNEKPQYVVASTSFLLARGKALNLSVYCVFEGAADLEWLRVTTLRWIEDLQRLNAR